MRKKWILTAVLGLTLFLSACSAPSGEKEAEKNKTSQKDSVKADGKGYHKITAEEAKEMMDERGVTVLDVRTSEEYKDSHIPDAVNIPNEEIGTEKPDQLPDQDAVVIVYCRTGVRSKQASDKLVDMGYKNVYDMGGIVDWNYETKSEKAPG